VAKLKNEYMVKSIEGKMPNEDLKNWLNRISDTEGWHLIAVDNGQYIFERVIEYE